MVAMSCGVAVSPSTAAAGLLLLSAPSPKVITEARNSTVVVVSTSRPTGRSLAARSCAAPPRRVRAAAGTAVRVVAEAIRPARRWLARSWPARSCGDPLEAAQARVLLQLRDGLLPGDDVRRVVEEGVRVAGDREPGRLLEEARVGGVVGRGRPDLAELDTELRAVRAARVHQPRAAEQHLEGLHRRL